MAQSPSVAMPIRFPMVESLNNRSTLSNLDSRMINAYGEMVSEGDYWVYKRPGLSALYTNVTGDARGMWHWLGDIYMVAGTTFYKNGTALATVDGANGSYRFNQSKGGTPRLFLMNGSYAFTYDGSAFAQVTDGNYPTSLVKGAAYLNGTMYVMDSAGIIRGSDLNDPTSWPVLNSITAQIESDQGVALAQQNTFIVAFKGWSTEFFWDAGNATGSPLSPNLPAKLNWGCASAESVQEIDGELFWVAANKSASLTVMKMVNTQPTRVSNKAIEKILNNVGGPAITHSWTFRGFGHRFYAITSTSAGTGIGTGFTLVLDIDEGLWAYWTDASYNYFPIAATTFGNTTVALMQHMTNGNVYEVDNVFTSDAGAIIPVDIYTPNADLNTRRKKMISMLEFIGDQTSGSTLSVSCSDDDYATFSAARTVDLSKARPQLDKCGTFSRRAYRLHHESDTAFHMKAIEMQIDIGTL